MPSIKYPLPSLSPTPQDCHNIEKIYKHASSRKADTTRTSPKQLSMEANPNLNTEQGISQLQALLSSLWSVGPKQTLSLITISWAQLLAGTGFPILNDVQTPIPHLYPMKWVPSIRQYMASNNSHITLEQTFVTPLQQEGDIHIMNLALQYTNHPITCKYSTHVGSTFKSSYSVI